MRLLLCTLNYEPEIVGIGKYSSEFCAWMAGRGHDITVLTGYPYYPAWRLAPGYPTWRYSSETLQGVRVRRCPLWVPREPSGLWRMLHLTSFGLSVGLRLLGCALERYDAVLLVEPTLAAALPVAWYSGITGARSFLHVQDLELEAGLALFGSSGSGAMSAVVRRVDKGLSSSFDVVSTISEGMASRLRQKIADGRDIVLWPNWVDTSLIDPQLVTGAFRRSICCAKDDVVVLYSGNMGAKQGLETLIDTARALEDRRDIQFVLCGDGSSRTTLEARAEGLSNVRFLPLQPLGQLNELLGAADIHVILERADASDLVMPSKLTGQLASGRPTIAAAVPGSALDAAVTASGGGVTVGPEDSGALAAAIVELADDPQRRAELGVRARRYACENLGRDSVLQRFEAVLLEKCGQ